MAATARVTTAAKGLAKADVIEALGEAFRVSGNRNQAFDELVAKRLGINLTDLRCLDIIEREQPIPAGALAEAAGLTTGAVTSILDRMEEAGYARRVPDETDRRRVLVELTPEWNHEAWEIYGPMKDDWVALLNRYTADELRLMLDMMHRGEEVALRHLERMRSLELKRGPARRAPYER